MTSNFRKITDRQLSSERIWGQVLPPKSPKFVIVVYRSLHCMTVLYMYCDKMYKKAHISTIVFRKFGLACRRKRSKYHRHFEYHAVTSWASKISDTGKPTLLVVCNCDSTIYALWQVSKKPDIAITMSCRFDVENRRNHVNRPFQKKYQVQTVSYTHLTLPTILRV